MTRRQAAPKVEPSTPGATSPDVEPAAAPRLRPEWTLTRREFVLTATAAVTVAGCAPFAANTSTPPPTTAFHLDRPVSLVADVTVPADLAAAVALRLGGRGGIPSAYATTSALPAPDFVLTFGAAPKGYGKSAVVGQSAFALAAHPRLPIEEVSATQARDLLAGRLANWQAAGAPYSVPVKVLSLAGLSAPHGVSPQASASVYPTLAALLAALRSTPGAIAALPTEALDWSLHHVGVDGVFPGQGRGDLKAYDLGALPLRLCVSDALARVGCDPAAVGAGVGPALAAATPTVDFLAAGDIMLGRGVLNQMLARNDFSFPYRAMRDELASADLRLANLECMVTDLVAPPSDPTTFTFICPTKGLDGLTYAGFDVVSVANNHSNGEGQAVFADMLDTLHARGIATCGGGANLDAATAPVIKTVKGTRIAILAYDNIGPQGPFATDGGWGLAPIDVNRLPRDIQTARAQADLVIPFFHWGIEYTKDPTSYQQSVAHAAIDAGADMVLGNHPHWTQAIERYADKLIIYSMGNFVFDQDWSEATMEGMVLHLYWRAGKLVSVRFRPTIDVSRCQPRVMTPAEAVNVFDRMWSGTDMLAAGQHGAG